MSIEFKKISIEDVPFVNDVRNRYAEDFLHTNNQYTLEESYDWFLKTNPDFWIIFKNELRVGYFRLSNYSSENKNIYIGADISEEFSGKGIATESYKKFIPFVFEKYNLNKISLEVLSTNERAIHLYKKLGFKLEGIKREEILKKEKFVDSILMSILKKEIYL